MSIESIIETRPWQVTAGTGTFTTDGTTGIVGVGTAFDTELAVDDILVWDDGTGKRAMGQIDSITDATNLDLVNAPSVVVAGASFSFIDSDGQTVPFFRADNAVLRSPIIQPTLLPMGVDQTSLFLKEIDSDEGLLVKSIFMRMPFQYTLGDSHVLVSFDYLDEAGASLGAINEIGEVAFFNIPGENIEIPINKYVSRPTTTEDRWQIGLQVDNGLADLGVAFAVNDFLTANVSQAEAPDILNEQLLPIFVGLRILHANTPLTD